MNPADTAFDAVEAAARQGGGWCVRLPHHVLAWVPAGHRRLVVSFDNLSALRDDGPRWPWGYSFLAAGGWDVLGVMIRRKDWFRDPALWAALERLRDDGLFRRYDHVAMYGSSMGGFGALTFAPLAPGCTVLALAPQTTLAEDLAPFETRYRWGRAQGDWAGPWRDAAEGAKAAGKVYLGFDPAQPLDRAHVQRLAAVRPVLLPMPHLGHKLPPALSRMGLLKPLAEAALTGGLTGPGFYRLFRGRRNSVPWLAGLIERAGRRHPAAARALADRLITERPHWKLRQARRALDAAGPAPVNSDSGPT
jgi:hypothetical protein